MFRKRSILIEKYIEPSEVEVKNSYIAEIQLDKYGDKHSKLCQPSEVWIGKNGEIIGQWWHKKGKEIRKNGDSNDIFRTIMKEEMYIIFGVLRNRFN
jgi:hypothetical protein